jgi:lysyl-tRNA synthetase class I
MEYLHSIRDTISAICEKHQKDELIQARIGMRTNGDLHLGNLLPIIAAVIIGKELIAKGYKYKLISILVDQEINGDDLPFNYLKYSENETLAEYSINNVKNFILELTSGVDDFMLEYKTVSESQKTEVFRKFLIRILDNSDDEIPIYTPCKKCGELLKKYKKNNTTLVYGCNQCDSDYALNLEDLNEELMLDHDLLGAIENNLFNIDLHILGADHAIKNNGITRMEKRANYQKILNGVSDYLTLLTPLVFFNNEKMSKSNKNGIFLNEIKAFFKNDYLGRLVKFVQKNNAESEITITNIKDI